MKYTVLVEESDEGSPFRSLVCQDVIRKGRQKRKRWQT